MSRHGMHWKRTLISREVGDVRPLARLLPAISTLRLGTVCNGVSINTNVEFNTIFNTIFNEYGGTTVVSESQFKDRKTCQDPNWPAWKNIKLFITEFEIWIRKLEFIIIRFRSRRIRDLRPIWGSTGRTSKQLEDFPLAVTHGHSGNIAVTVCNVQCYCHFCFCDITLSPPSSSKVSSLPMGQCHAELMTGKWWKSPRLHQQTWGGL
jgi:hypothetical protein